MLVDVVVPFPIDRSFHYTVSPEQREQLSLGSVVEVSFRSRETHAFVLGFPDKSDLVIAKIKPVTDVLMGTPLFDEEMLRFFRWVADYYHSPLGEVISLAIPAVSWRMAEGKQKRKPRASGVVEAMAVNGKIPQLTEEQTAALEQILSVPQKPSLLHGVTGSGKTEVYMQLMERNLAEGKSAIVLVPEIALTPQLLGRFSSRFPDRVAVLHSDLTAREKYVQWERVRKGEAKVVVGARSAVFAPVTDLGLIIVDEEHEPSFKQEDSVRYHARDVALVRAHFQRAKVVLGSATPSVESYHNATTGRYQYVQMKQRVEARPLPKVQFANLRDGGAIWQEKYPWLSRVLFEQINATLARHQQVILFLNRLGAAHFLFCEDCGHTWRCKNCDVALTYYRHPPRLKCHYCGVDKRAPHSCEECQGSSVKPMGFGTEQIEVDLREIYPAARIGRLDRSVVRTRKQLEGLLGQMGRGELDILIGTQMVAKGHDFPGIALVGILMADASLNIPDFRANERTFQIVTQVSGRAGRADIAGTVVIQTINPEAAVLQFAALNKTDEFYRGELATRSQFGFPPFHRMAMLRFQHSNPQRVERFSHDVCLFVQKEIKRLGLSCTVLGPSEAPLAKLKNQHRWQCLIKADSVQPLHQLLRHVEAFREASESKVQLYLDIDPISAL